MIENINPKEQELEIKKVVVFNVICEYSNPVELGLSLSDCDIWSLDIANERIPEGFSSMEEFIRIQFEIIERARIRKREKGRERQRKYNSKK